MCSPLPGLRYVKTHKIIVIIIMPQIFERGIFSEEKNKKIRPYQLTGASGEAKIVPFTGILIITDRNKQ